MSSGSKLVAQYAIWGGWYGGPDYEVVPIKRGKITRDRDGYGGPGYRLKDCRRWLKKKYPESKYKIKFSRGDGEWHVDVFDITVKPEKVEKRSVPHHQTESALVERLRADGIRFTHRQGRTNCNFCSYDSVSDTRKLGYRIWLKAPHIKEVIFETRFGKRSSIVVISSCPKCRELSWEHFGLLMLLDCADDMVTLDKKAILGEICRRVRKNKKTWDEGTCHDCIYLTFAGYDYVDLMITTRCSKGCSPFDGYHETYPEGERCPKREQGAEHPIDQNWYERFGIFLDPPIFVGDVDFVKWKYEKAFDKPWEEGEQK